MPIVRQGLVIVSLLASAAAYAGAPGWSLSETSGQVTVASTGLVKAAVRGGGVSAGDIVSTGRTGRAVLVRGEEYLVVAPNSRIRVADPAKTGGMTQIIEQFGNVIFKIKKMTMPHFAVETPFLAAVVKGTTFSVTVTDKGASVQVIEGRVEVATRDGGASYMVLPGDIGSVSANAPGRLSVQGHESKSINSPTPDAAAAAVTASVKEGAGPAGDVQLSGAIEAPVGEGAVNLASMTDGMVKGDSSMMAMVAMTSEGSREPAAATTSGVALALNDPTPLTAEAETVAAVPPTPAPETVEALPPTPAPETVEALPPTPVAGGDVVDEAQAPGSKPVNTTVTATAPVPAAIGNSGNGNANGNGNSGNGNGNGNNNSNRFAFGGNGNNDNNSGTGRED